MNETSEKLLRELAEKFGTTAEYLWGVLLKQALLSSILDLAVFGVFAIALAWGFRSIRRASAEWDVEPAIITWIVWGFIALGGVAIFMDRYQGVASGFLNPEFKALRYILR